MIYLIILVGMAAVVMGRTLLERGGYTQFPFFFSAVYFGWAIPQLVALQRDPFLPDGSLDRVTIMATLCLAATAAAWWWPIKPRDPRKAEEDVTYSVRKLFRAACGLALFAAVVQRAMSFVDIGVAANGQWTGPITILAMLSQAMFPAFAIAFVMWIRLRTMRTFILLLFNVFLYAPIILIYARRSELAGVATVVLISLWFVRRTVLPRGAMLLMLVLGALIVNSIGEIRSTSYGVDDSGHFYLKEKNWSEMVHIDFLGNLPLFDYKKAVELESAAFMMRTVAETASFNFGAGIWNIFITRYVPGQFIGFERKQQLMFDEDIVEATLHDSGYVTVNGATETGFSDAFRAFWYFGALLFYANARMLRHLYDRGMRGRLWAQTLYMCLMTFAMQTVTHNSANMLVAAPVILLFTTPIFLYARVRQKADRGMTPAAVQQRLSSA